MNTLAFNPQGNTVVISAAAAAPLGLQALVSTKYDDTTADYSAGHYRIVNASTNTVHLGTGSTAAEAQANAVAPVAGVPSPALVLVAGAVEIIRFDKSTFFSGLAAAASTVYITPGSGI